MGQLAGGLGGGGGTSLQASSSASAGPQAGTTGSLVLNFGGINLGNQDIPLNASTTSATNQTPTLGNTPLSALGASLTSGSSSFIPLVLIAAAVFALYMYEKKR